MASLRQNRKAFQTCEAGYELAVGFTVQHTIDTQSAVGALARSHE
jgi:hypothetical protein